MIVERIWTGNAYRNYNYLIACPESGEALAIDPLDHEKCLNTARVKGWQIGSGPTESQCKLCTKRLKGHGRRWDRPNATAVAALDTLDRSGQWHKFWPNASPIAV